MVTTWLFHMTRSASPANLMTSPPKSRMMSKIFVKYSLSTMLVSSPVEARVKESMALSRASFFLEKLKLSSGFPILAVFIISLMFMPLKRDVKFFEV